MIAANLEAKPDTDALLLPYLRAAHAEQVAESAKPLIEGVVKSKLHVSLLEADGSRQNQDALEICGDVYVALTAQLRALKADPTDKAISNFRGYVSSTAYHACAEYLRAKFPRRTSLSNKLRYLLTHNQNFALWENSKGQLCGGRTAWRGDEDTATATARLNDLRATNETLNLVETPAKSQAARDGDPEIFTMNRDGSDVTQLTFNTAVDYDPAWSPDGTAQTRLTSNTAIDYLPTWSPDGLRLAFESHRSGTPNIYIMYANQ